MAQQPPSQTTHPSRRNTLRAAAVGASLVWTAPLVQAVTMDSASAASGPPPSSPGGNGNGNTNGNGNGNDKPPGPKKNH